MVGRRALWNALHIGFIVAVLFGMSGCAKLNEFIMSDTNVYDSMPHEVKKGFIEFYSDEETDEEPGFDGQTYTISKLEYGRKIKADGILWSVDQKRRIAERPGWHTYFVRFGTAEKKIDLEVRDGMTTPVHVRIIPIRVEKGIRSGTYTYKKYFFDMHVTVDPLVEFERWEEDTPWNVTGPRIYDLETAEVFSRAVEAVKKIKWEITDYDRSTGGIFARIHGFTVPITHASIGVHKNESGKTQVDISCRIYSQYYDGGKNIKNIVQFYEMLDGLCGVGE